MSIRGCLIDTVLGIASRSSIPPQIDKDVDKFETMATTSLIKKVKLSEAQKLFIEIIRKIFFQHGAGRKEAALLRGMGVAANRPLGQKILSILLHERLVTRHKGDEGYIYKPVRNKTGRMDEIIKDLTLSDDSIWRKISDLVVSRILCKPPKSGRIKI